MVNIAATEGVLKLRPHNETAEDLAREDEARREIETAWRCEATKLSELLYGVDWVFHRGETLLGFGEFKWRAQNRAGQPVRRDTFKTLVLSLAKWMKLRALSRETGQRSFVVVRWDDGLYAAVTDDEKRKVAIGGNARGQAGDIEPVIHIPVTEFRRIV